MSILLLIGWLCAVLITWAIDDEEQQVKDGTKDPRTTLLPITDH